MGIDNGFYLGRVYDPESGQTTAERLLYEPDDLTTHAVVVGMTGSGKTGLCVDLMEEAALKGVPALMIDPKGDITNLLLHFPDLSPENFQPWVNADQARRDGKSIEQAAAETAQTWREGLAGWEIGPERIKALKDSAQFAVYTPGSDAGLPVSILSSLKAPSLPWEENRELLREEISGTVTALLGLVGLQDIDPVRSREHILLANIFENAWSKGSDLDLGELILQTQNPPFSKLGVFEVNTFFPEKDRFELAMQLNNILAAPAFQVWLEGQPLDIPGLLYTPEGKARHSIFYIAHLPDAERMFFVTLLFSAVEAWMRAQPGTPSLRALIYFDEIFGYLPPTQNPPSKVPMLRMLKQARAFGVGLVLVTQNPVDLDYKGLSNAGSWFVGKLQTDQDKQRLLDGLEGASPGFERRTYDRMISSLGKRVFLLHNVHEKKPVLFQTRWAMSYLAGPLSRSQLGALNRLVMAGAAEDFTAAPVNEVAVPAVGAPVDRPVEQIIAKPVAQAGSVTRPAVPTGIAEYFLPNNLTFTESFQAANRAYPEDAHSQGLIYRPVLCAQASVRFFERKYNLDSELRWIALVSAPDRRGIVRWEEFPASPVDPGKVSVLPDPQGRFASLEAPLSDVKIMAAMKGDFEDWVYRTAMVDVRANEELNVYAGPQLSQAEFRKLCSEAARSGRDAELEKVSASFDRKIESFQEKITREERELAQDEAEHSQRKLEELGNAAETLIGLFGRRRRSISSSLTKRRMTTRAGADVKESKEAIAEFEKQIAQLQAEKEAALKEVSERWEEIAGQATEIQVAPAKKDILVELFGVAWFPYYAVKVGEEVVELPGFDAERRASQR
jgi:hypothetical protein